MFFKSREVFDLAQSDPTTQFDKIDYSRESILVVDDEEPVRESLAHTLIQLGFNAQSAASALEALDILESDAITFLVTDMKMPEMDGMELIRQVAEQYPEVCIIALTGFAKGYGYVDVINAGATDFINKPFRLEELEAKIRRAIIERDIRRELNRLSITDSLTGLYNQRHFYDRLKEEVARARRQKRPLSIIVMDLNAFKAYNDTYGHMAGDELLKKVGKIISKSIREGVDSGFRYGGDEFAVILIDADETIALEIASRIKNAIKKECSVDISFGVASFSEEASDVERLLKKADKELYLSRGIELKALTGNGGA